MSSKLLIPRFEKLFTIFFSLTYFSLGFGADWNLIDADGYWNDNANWTPASFPNKTDAVANFPDILTSAHVVSLGASAQNITFGTINIDSSSFGKYTIAPGFPGNKLIARTSSGSAIINPSSGSATTISAPIHLKSPLILSDGVLISGEISGRQGVTIITQNANGKVSYHANNSYTGLTNIIGGGLGGLECASPGFAFAGDLQCSSSLSFTGDQLPHNAHVTLLDGAFVTSSTTTLTMNSLDFLGGIFFNDETLDLGIILTGSDVALRMRNTTYDHPIQLTGGGSVVFDNTNDGTATITYTLDLGGNNATIFNIAKGTADIDMLISAVISNGGIVKTGPGVLSLTNANTYTAGTVVSSGELLLNAPGMNAISGDVVVKGGTVTLATPNQIPDTSTVSVSN